MGSNGNTKVALTSPLIFFIRIASKSVICMKTKIKIKYCSFKAVGTWVLLPQYRLAKVTATESQERFVKPGGGDARL